MISKEKKKERKKANLNNNEGCKLWQVQRKAIIS